MDAPGKLVQVNDTAMHVFSVPEPTARNRSTVVFLAGSCTECPTYDFMPLWRLLAGRRSIAVVERPGYGWSCTTLLPRDIDTLLEETREALRQAGVAGPFVLAAHSLSSLEALYWAQRYPGEVSPIVGLDMVVPKAYDAIADSIDGIFD